MIINMHSRRPRGRPIFLLALGAALLPGVALAASFQPPISYSVGSGPQDVLAVDLNRDGVLDLVTADTDADQLSVLLGDGSGGFGPATAFPTGTSPVALDTADFNLDSNPDLAVAAQGANAASILLGDGNGGFGPPVDYALAAGPRWIAAGDLNEDGLPDVVSSDGKAPDLLRVLLGQGGGTMAPGGTFAVGKRITSGTVADLDGDGHLDAVVTSRNEGVVFVLLGDGNGAFAPATAYPSGSSPRDVIVLDVDGDGILDLVTVNAGDSTVAVLPGLGSGTFGPPAPYATGNSSTGVLHGDFDGDCVQDLTVVNPASGEVTVLAGDGAGGFGSPESFAVGSDPQGFVMADFNGDLRADLAVVSAVDGTVSVLLSDSLSVCNAFYVRRSTNPAAVRSTAALASVSTGPFDDEPGLLSDSQTYFYVVDHAGDLPVLLSAHANTQKNTVRLGFDDGDPTSAAVDGLMSSLSAGPAAVPADGTSVSTVTVVPRDADGLSLGCGLDLSVDAVALLPGRLAGPVRDQGNGIYVLDVVSDNPGASTVSVTVEGMVLAQTPSILFEIP